MKARGKTSVSMIFNSGNKAAGSGNKPLIIKVDGKEITCTEDDKMLNLRKILMKNNIDVYPLKSKISGNCGGAGKLFYSVYHVTLLTKVPCYVFSCLLTSGICGTCAIKVIDGASNLSAPSKNEQNTLKGKPADFRLSCCAKVNGPVSIKTKP